MVEVVEPPPSGFGLQQQSRHRRAASSAADLRSPYSVVVLPPSTSSAHVQQQPLPLRVECADTDLRSPDAMLSNSAPCRRHASRIARRQRAQTNSMPARHESARSFALNDCDLFYLRIQSMMCLRVYMCVKICLYEWTRVEKKMK
ncbi:uncharacterized protein [Zea mays]|uniref:uncharacterized protein n=1 Tax=Zea mays TaxID=4577 RepID=UPI000C6C5640|nr:uncharacterized protein LOC111590611 [Zea mays]|eukprot:XP_023157178.1 uncharacterized protein LOC111590611 [Zea mays]